MTWFVGIVIVAIFLIALPAIRPTQIGDFVSHATPARDYADAIGRVALQQQSDDSVVAPEGRTVLMTHGAPTARTVILLHGLTNSPRQYEHLAARLHAAGDNVYIPRICLLYTSPS